MGCVYNGLLEAICAGKRGSGQRREKKLVSTQIPSDWKEFLRVDLNKEELFKLLANKVTTMMIWCIL